MKLLDLTLDTPAENLACDEALLDLCEEEGVETLRFWESRQHFVVVGYGNSVEREVNVSECKKRGTPVLRRCSGGGTVLQGPGCLNYNLTLRVPATAQTSRTSLATHEPLFTVTGTNEFVMERNRAALEQLLDVKVAVQGHTDLACATSDSRWLKFSGNAQRRRRHSLVFHGTILYDFNLPLIDVLLNFPSAQPNYRAGRGHSEFLCNIPATGENIRDALRFAWKADEPAPVMAPHHLDRLLREQYLNDDWNFRR